jgi:sugar phosphate isomerase/epimerase
VTSPLRIGISSGHFDWKGLDEAFRRVREEMGFDLLEIWSEQIGYPPAKETALELRRLSAEHGVALAYHAPIVEEYGLAQKDAHRSALVLKELLTVCGRIHAEFLIVHLGSNPDKAQGLRCAMSAFSQNIHFIEKHGLKVAVEVVPTIWGNQVGDDIADFEQLFRAIDEPWLGFNLDFGHAQLNRHLDACIDRLGPHLSYAHVQDTRGDLDEHLGYGMGVIDWERALRRTLETGFRGPFVIEYPELHGADKTERFLADLRRLAVECDAEAAALQE